MTSGLHLEADMIDKVGVFIGPQLALTGGSLDGPLFTQPGPFRLLNQLLHDFGRGLDTLYRADRLSRSERHRPDRSCRRLIGDATPEAKDRNSRPIQAARLADNIALEGFRCRDGRA